MLVNCVAWHNRHFGKLLRYMVKQSRRPSEEFDFILTHNIKSKNNTVKEWVSELRSNENLRTRRRKDNVIFNHFIISYSPEDTKRLTPEAMKDMTQSLIREYGIEGMYVAVPHVDKDHLHVHVLATTIGYRTAKSLHKSWNEFEQMKVNVQNYQREHYPDLVSIVDHGKKRRERIQKREDIIKLLRNHLTDEGEPKDNITFALLGAEIYERNGKPYGVMYSGRRYRFKVLGIERKKTKEQSRLDKLKQIRDREGKDLER